ncbi:hypothetical protein ACPJHQ_02355 [Rossellomorea sp. H39__3]
MGALNEEELVPDIEASYADTDENVTMRRITAVRFQGNQCYFLRNRSLKVMTYRNIREYQMKDFEKWKEIIQEVYQFDSLALRDSIRFLEDRKIDLFRDNPPHIDNSLDFSFEKRYDIVRRVRCPNEYFGRICV